MKEFNFPLSESIEYMHDGDLHNSSEINCVAPSPKLRKKTGRLKQMFFRALPKEAPEGYEKDVKKEDVEMKAEEVLFLIAQSEAVDYSDFIEAGCNLLCSGVAFVSEGVPLKQNVLEKISTIDEMEELVGSYVANFIVRSALK